MLINVPKEETTKTTRNLPFRIVPESKRPFKKSRTVVPKKRRKLINVRRTMKKNKNKENTYVS